MIEDMYNFERHAWKPAASARRFECGSPNMLGIHALTASLALLEEIGLKEIQRRVLGNAEYLFAGIRARPHLQLITRTDEGRYAGIVTFRHTTVSDDKLYQHLLGHSVVCAKRGGGIRFSPHVYNSHESLELALDYCEL